MLVGMISPSPGLRPTILAAIAACRTRVGSDPSDQAVADYVAVAIASHPDLNRILAEEMALTGSLLGEGTDGANETSSAKRSAWSAQTRARLDGTRRLRAVDNHAGTTIRAG